VNDNIPKISVIVTCYNCERYVEDAVRSVARQTLRGFECVIVDDASTDGSAEAIRRILDELNDPRFVTVRLDANLGQTGASREGLRHANAPFVCFLDADDLWNDNFLEHHLAAHLNETYSVGFTACNARIIDGDGVLLAGGVYWFGRNRDTVDRDQEFVPVDTPRVPTIDPDKGIVWQRRTSYVLYTRRALQWVWVSTSSMMFRRSLIDLVFPDDDKAFRLHMDFYLVVMAQMVTGCLLIDDSLYSYRLHGRNFAASNPVLGGRLHLSPRDLTSTYAEMLDRMLGAMVRDHQRFSAALGANQYGQMIKAMQGARRPAGRGSLWSRLGFLRAGK
jgi:glycosyltransferase involved in cell wall biosynthesis